MTKDLEKNSKLHSLCVDQGWEREIETQFQRQKVTWIDWFKTKQAILIVSHYQSIIVSKVGKI